MPRSCIGPRRPSWRSVRVSVRVPGASCPSACISGLASIGGSQRRAARPGPVGAWRQRPGGASGLSAGGGARIGARLGEGAERCLGRWRRTWCLRQRRPGWPARARERQRGRAPGRVQGEPGRVSGPAPSQRRAAARRRPRPARGCTDVARAAAVLPANVAGGGGPAARWLAPARRRKLNCEPPEKRPPIDTRTSFIERRGLSARTLSQSTQASARPRVAITMLPSSWMSCGRKRRFTRPPCQRSTSAGTVTSCEPGVELDHHDHRRRRAALGRIHSAAPPSERSSDMPSTRRPSPRMTAERTSAATRARSRTWRRSRPTARPGQHGDEAEARPDDVQRIGLELQAGRRIDRQAIDAEQQPEA
jgi:hypothetical protein